MSSKASIFYWTETDGERTELSDPKPADPRLVQPPYAHIAWDYSFEGLSIELANGYTSVLVELDSEQTTKLFRALRSHLQ